MYTYSWLTPLYRRNENNIVKQLYSNKDFKKESKSDGTKEIEFLQ